MPNSHKAAAARPTALPDDLRYIVIEGVIGVGKTTFSREMAARFDAELVLEEFEENPFLENFYADPSRWGFQTQLSFLASRFRQQKALGDRNLFHPVVLADYSFDKDRIFAHINLQGDELQLYETLFSIMEPVTPVPDLLVYLRSTPERLLKNIAQRGRSYETDMDPAYIAALCEAYEFYFTRYKKSALLIVDVEEIDFVQNPEELEVLVQLILSSERQGTATFRPSPLSAAAK